MREYVLKNISRTKLIIHRPSDKSSLCHFMTDKLSSQREAVLRNILGAYKPIIAPIGMSDGAFTSLFTLPYPPCLSLAMSRPADGVGTMGWGRRGGTSTGHNDDSDGDVQLGGGRVLYQGD